ncbi:MAG: hypothetical protein KDC83_01755 [Flavobacteriales bacterium]|nr:hypothetical protein [Flavobacteriales bacterium]
MKISALLFGIFICGILQTNAQEINQMDAMGRKQGVWSKTYPDGVKRYTGQFKNDKPIGTFTYYNEDGDLSSTIKNFGDSASAIYYHVNGNVIAEGKYYLQKRTGIWKHFDADGDISSQEMYADGKKNGPARIYFKDGKIAKELNYQMGTMSGDCIEFFPSGSVKSKFRYVDDKIEGPIEHYYNDERIWIKGYYTNNMRDKIWSYYKQEGGIDYFEIYDLGVLKGTKTPDEMKLYNQEKNKN